MKAEKPCYVCVVKAGFLFFIFISVPGQPGKFRAGKVTDTSIELTWDPPFTKEKIINYELLYKPVKFGSLVRFS